MWNHAQGTEPPLAFVVLRTELCIAFLDIMPLSPGHLLVCSRAHHEKISDVSLSEAEELGRWLRVLSRVLANVTGVQDWNIVQNNGKKPSFGSPGVLLMCRAGAAAAQVVPHVHYHIIPRPALTDSQRNRSFTMFGRGQRSELDEDEAGVLIEKLKKELEEELAREKIIRGRAKI
jgi:diadenosine tetraphosphate (Ap4A) HIT family hydrolase